MIRRPPLRYLVVAVVAALAFVGALAGPAVYSALTDTTAKDRIEADPPPPLFPTEVTHRVDRLIQPQATRAAHLLQSWWDDHGTTEDDAGFESWLEEHFPAPPGPDQRKREMAEVVRLDQQRTAAGVAAADWLEVYGKDDIWKLEVHDQAEYLSPSVGDGRKNAIDDMTSMSKDVADALGLRFESSAPYVLKPELRTDHVVEPGDVCPCSYPSRHASAGAASRTFLSWFAPQRRPDYRYFEDQIDYSRIYMAGHFASDISGGALLGDMIGDYFLVTRGDVDPSALESGGQGSGGQE